MKMRLRGKWGAGYLYIEREKEWVVVAVESVKDRASLGAEMTRSGPLICVR